MASLTAFLRPVRLLLAVAVLAAGGCAWLTEEDETAGWSASRLYSEAKEDLSDGNYERAIELFEKLQARYPLGRFAQQAQLELVYAHHRSDAPDQAIAAADRFIRTFPRHPFVDYAYYMKGLVNYSRNVTALDRLLPRDPTKTDSAAAQRSFDDFAELVRRFPESGYAEDARQRMVFLRNNLAGYEVNVARFYLVRDAHVAAVRRAQRVVEEYPRSPAVLDALAIMTEAYLELGLDDLASDTLRVLALNAPDDERLARLNRRLSGAGGSLLERLAGE